MTPEEQSEIRELLMRIESWRLDDEAGYCHAIKLLGHLETRLEALVAPLREPIER